MDHSAGLAPYHNMITELVRDGWDASTDPFAGRFTATTRTHLTCPADYLHMTIETSTDGAVHCRLAIAQGGHGEPARWRASAAAPPATYWLAAARAAYQGVATPAQVNLYPGDVLTRHGWKQLHAQPAAGSLRSVWRCPHGASRVSHQPSQRAMPTLWSITRPGASIGVIVNAAEPRALPALILALATGPARHTGCCNGQLMTRQTE